MIVWSGESLQDTIDAGHDVYVEGTHTLSEMLVVKPGVHLKLAKSAVLQTSEDIDLVRLMPGSAISRGRLITSGRGAALLVDGVDRFSFLRNLTLIKDITITGPATSGIGIDCRSTGEKGSICAVMADNCVVRNFEHGIRLQRSGPSCANWINGNIFSNMWIAYSVYGISLSSDLPPPYVDIVGNTFAGIQFQPHPTNTQRALVLEGQLNKFDMMVWDWPTSKPTKAILIQPGMRGNYVSSNVPAENLAPTTNTCVNYAK